MTGMADRHKLAADRKSGQKLLKEVSTNSQTIISKKVDEILKRHEAIEGRIRELQAEKRDFLSKPPTKKEWAEIIKASVHGQKGHLVMLLSEHLAECQGRNVMPFNSRPMREITEEKNLWRLFVMALTDADVDAMVDGLPDIDGISQTQREAEIKRIDDEIEQLSKEIKGELAEAMK